MDEAKTYTAFAGARRLASGSLEAVLRKPKAHLAQDKPNAALSFDDATGKQVDFDFRGSSDEVVARAIPEDKPGPGRPRLGVVSREVTLLPRHWEWLEQQRQGISGALRRLVDEARKREPGKERARVGRDAAGKFMWTMAGNLPDFEEASRALFAKDDARLAELARGWPKDIRNHVLEMVARSVRMETEKT